MAEAKSEIVQTGTGPSNDTHVEELKTEDDERMDEARGRNADKMPPGYFYSKQFLG